MNLFDMQISLQTKMQLAVHEASVHAMIVVLSDINRDSKATFLKNILLSIYKQFLARSKEINTSYL